MGLVPCAYTNPICVIFFPERSKAGPLKSDLSTKDALGQAFVGLNRRNRGAGGEASLPPVRKDHGMAQKRRERAHLEGLAAELVEEDLREPGDARVTVAQAERQARDVALHLHHVVQDEVRQHHQARLAHACKGAAQALRCL